MFTTEPALALSSDEWETSGSKWLSSFMLLVALLRPLGFLTPHALVCQLGMKSLRPAGWDNLICWDGRVLEPSSWLFNGLASSFILVALAHILGS